MKTMFKERVLFVVKYLTGFALLFWILYRIDRAQMVSALTDISGAVILTLLGLVFINVFAQFARWKYLVESNSSSYDTHDLIPSFFAGFAFRLMIPGGHAEITKIYLLPGKKNGKVFAFGIEKFFQTFIKVMLVLLALPFVFPELQFYMWGAAMLVLAGYFLLPFLLKGSFFSRLHEKEVNYPKIFLRTLVFSVAVFICLTFQYYILINEIHQIDLISTGLVVIFIWSAGLIPISVSGLGVRENLAVFFLAQYDIPGYTAVGLSLLVFFLNSIVPAMAGVYFIMIKRHHLKDAGGIFKSARNYIYPKKVLPRLNDLNTDKADPAFMLQKETGKQAS